MGGLLLSIRISGSITEIKRKLLAINSVVKFRQNSGWAPYQSDETWFYESEQDDNVCPVCLGFELTQFFAGAAIPFNFSRAEQIDPLHLIRPRVHEDHTELKGICRCTLEWLDSVATLAERLRLEMEEVSE